MTIKTYNGWTNRDTWAAHLWLTNDEGAYEIAQSVISPSILVREFHNLFFSPNSGKYIDDINILKVNFNEIFHAIQDGKE